MKKLPIGSVPPQLFFFEKTAHRYRRLQLGLVGCGERLVGLLLHLGFRVSSRQACATVTQSAAVKRAQTLEAKKQVLSVGAILARQGRAHRYRFGEPIPEVLDLGVISIVPGIHSLA